MTPGGHRPGIGEIFDRAGAVFQQRWGALTGITLLIDLPLTFLQGQLFGSEDVPLRAQAFSNLLGLLGFISAAAVIRIAADRISGAPDAPWHTALAFGLSTFPRLAVTALLLLVLLFGGMLLLIVPGLILGVQASYLAWTVVLRGEGGMTAFRSSRSLVRGSWWRTLGTLLALALPTFTIALIMSLPLLLVGDNIPLKTLLTAPALLASAYYLVCVTVLYRSLEPRLEAAVERPPTLPPESVRPPGDETSPPLPPSQRPDQP